MLIQGEEITARFINKPVHLNASNLATLITPKSGKSVREVIQNNVNAVMEQRRQIGRPILVHVNHPNFDWALTAEDIAEVAKNSSKSTMVTLLSETTEMLPI